MTDEPDANDHVKVQVKDVHLDLEPVQRTMAEMFWQLHRKDSDPVLLDDASPEDSYVANHLAGGMLNEIAPMIIAIVTDAMKGAGAISDAVLVNDDTFEG